MKEKTPFDVSDLSLGHRPEQLQRLPRVVAVEQRQRGLVLREALAVVVPRVLLLQVSGVEEQDLGQLDGRGRAVDGPPESPLAPGAAGGRCGRGGCG